MFIGKYYHKKFSDNKNLYITPPSISYSKNIYWVVGLVIKNKKVCFDIDGIICYTKNSDYRKSKPIKKNINFINKLYEQGFAINIYTARFMGRNKDNVALAKKEGYKFTLLQLKKWNVKYNNLFFGKPSSDIYIDDKDLNFKKNWIKILHIDNVKN